MKSCLALAAALTLSGITAAQADQVTDDDLIVNRHLLCLGMDCVDGELFNSTFDATLRMKANNILFEFEDTSAAAGRPNGDWKIQVNETFIGGKNALFFKDATAFTTPVTIEGGAPDSALWIADTGDIGIGTSLPARRLHMMSNVPTIRLENTGFGAGYAWDMFISNNSFLLRDYTSQKTPFSLVGNAPNGSLHVSSQGFVGMGTANPEGKLHTYGDGVQLAYFESGNGGPVQVRFRTNSENRRFLAVNNANEVKSQIIFKDNEILFTGATDSGANRWLTIGPSGIVSQGPTCNPGPCDATFDRDAFTVPSIEDHAAFMWENRHLWAVGPTKPDQPINLTQKTGGMLHELEVAHIYIEQLHDRLEAQEKRARGQDRVTADQARLIADLVARQTRLERVISAQETSAQ